MSQQKEPVEHLTVDVARDKVHKWLRGEGALHRPSVSMLLELTPAAPVGRSSNWYRGGLRVPVVGGQGRVAVRNHDIRWEIEGRHDYGDCRVLFYDDDYLIYTTRLERSGVGIWQVNMTSAVTRSHATTPAFARQIISGSYVLVPKEAKGELILEQIKVPPFTKPHDFPPWYIQQLYPSKAPSPKPAPIPVYHIVATAQVAAP